MNQTEHLQRDAMVFPLMSLRPFAGLTSHVLLLSGDLVQPQNRVRSLMDRIAADGAATIRFHFETLGDESLVFTSGADLHRKFSDDKDRIFQPDYYFEIVGGAVFGWNSARDSLAALFVERSLLSHRQIRYWDRIFCEKHAQSVGFGDEGQRYLAQLLATLAQPRPELTRISPP